jgi:hypothetical protein
MRVDNNKHTSKTVQEMQEQLNKCLDFEKKFGKTTRTTAWIKWCTDKEYRKREEEFRLASRNTLDSKINLVKYSWKVNKRI